MVKGNLTKDLLSLEIIKNYFMK